MNRPTLTLASDCGSSERAKQLASQRRERQYRRTDRLFSRLLLAEFVAGLAAALWISPLAWAGQDQTVHPHVWSAVWLGALIVSLPMFLARVHPGKALTRHVIGVAQLLMSGLLIHLTQGRIETHFHVFGSLAFLAFYRDWRVLVTASAVTTMDHLVRGYVWPLSIYGVELQSQWRWLEHAGWVIFENVFLIFAVQQSNRETNALAERHSQLESTNDTLHREHGLLEAIHSVQTQFLTSESPLAVFDEFLKHFLTLSKSEYGFIHEMFYGPDGQPILTARAITDISWNQESRKLYQQFVDGTLNFTNLKSLYGEVMKSGQPLIANDAPHDPRRMGIPSGHPPLKAFLGLPLLSSSQEFVGVIGLANRPEGYSEEVITYLQPMTLACANLVAARKNDQRRRQAERDLQHLNQQLNESNAALDRKVEERTAKLLATEERFELAVRGSTDGLWDWNVLTNDVYLSPRLKELLGYADEELPNVFETFESRLHPDDHDWVLREVDEHLQHRKVYDVEYRLRTKSGEYRWFRARGQGVWNDAGQPQRMAGSITDVTRRKQAEQALATANSQLAGVLDAATQVSIISTDVHGLITVFNSGAQNLLGYSSDEMIGKQTPQIIHLGDEVVARGEELTRELGYKVEGFEVFVANAKQGRFDHREWTYVRKDGRHFTVSLVVTAVKNVTGEITGFLGVAEDITARKRDEERFRIVVEAAPNAMVVVDPDRRITLVNSQTEELFGYKRQELIGQPVEVLVPDRFRPQHPSYVQGFFRDPKVRSMGVGRDLFGLKKNGIEVPIELGLNPIMTSEGTFVLASIINITERKRTESELLRAKEAAESASRAKSSFLANMSHEIRTPMNGIIGMSQLLARTELRSHQRDYLATVEESAHILLRLLNDILDFSKIEAGKLELECLDFRLSECVARASQMLVLRAAEKGLEIVCRVAPEIPDHLRGDPGRLQQVLVNLIGNAVKFTAAGEIFVNVDAESIAPEQVRLHISVSDTGIGIPADKRDQIFRPFEQAETSTTRRFGGTGLGLTISRQLVEMMHGQMWIDSEVGRGSTFHFNAEFGVASDQHLHTPAELDSLLDLPVLVVDDNFTNRRIFNEILQHWHMQPVLADSAAAARQALQNAAESRRPIRLILLDHHMPGEDGFHFAESVSSVLKREHCRIIMISSGSSPVDADLCQKHGIDRFMTKPVIASELLNEVLRQFGRNTTAAPSSVPPATSAHVPPRRVLLVEDNEINRRVAVGLLRSRGHQVVVAENGQEAVNTLSEQEFDVVLMDMQMPVMDGYEATIAIRKREHQTGGHIPIVAMTAEALKGDRERCLSIGMDDYVSKPIAPAAMYRAIERFPAVCLAAEPISKMREGKASAEPHALGENGSAGASSSRNPDVQTGKPPAIDWKVANKRLGGESQVMRELSDLLKAQSPALLADIRRAVETRDYKLLRLSAHTMKGSVNYFGAESLVQAASALETLGRSESLDGSTELLATLEQELARMLTALEIGPPD